MGTCCAAHLAAMVRFTLPNAQNGAVTVKTLENPQYPNVYGWIHKCGFCGGLGEFEISFYTEKER